MRPFRFGVNIVRAGSRDEWADKAGKVEDLGYSVPGVPDHLTEMLALTRLRVGTGVLAS